MSTLRIKIVVAAELGERLRIAFPQEQHSPKPSETKILAETTLDQKQRRLHTVRLTIPLAKSFGSSIMWDQYGVVQGTTGPSVHHAHSKVVTEAVTT